MQQFLFNAGDTSKTIDVFLPDSSSTTGAGLGGLVFNSAGLKCYYRIAPTGTATAITLATQTVGGAFSSGGFVEIDATNMKGLYRFDVPNAVLASAGTATLYFSGATNLAPVPVQLQMSAPVNVAQWNGTNVATPATAGVPDVNAKAVNNVATTSVTTINANIGTTQPTNFSGTGATAYVKADLEQWVGAAPLALSAQQVQAVVPSSTVVASVTGAVGSVTGNVGGNVTGSVGSVVGLTASNLDTTVSSRLASASYTAPDNAGITSIETTLGVAGAGLTNLGDARIAHLDANVSSRSTYAGGAADADAAAIKAQTDKIGTTAADSSNVTGIKAVTDALSPKLPTNTIADETLVIAATTSILTDTTTIKAKTNNLPASPAAVGSAMTLDLTQAVPTTNTAQTIGDALNAARAQGFGKWAITGTTLTLYAADGTTAVRTFTLDQAPPNATSRS